MSFAGDKKVGESILTNLEKQLVSRTVHLIPKSIETYHLTLLTILWSILVVIFGKLSQSSLSWLWGINVMIVLQYITDLYDGSLGRFRNTGLIKWGFFMDHFLDFVFICALSFAGFLLAPSELSGWYFILLVLLASFMVGSFLSFSCFNKFEIYHYNLGPTEFRILLIIVNIFLIYTGIDHLSYSLPLSCFLLLMGLIFYIWKLSVRLWRVDMESRNL